MPVVTAGSNGIVASGANAAAGGACGAGWAACPARNTGATAPSASAAIEREMKDFMTELYPSVRRLVAPWDGLRESSEEAQRPSHADRRGCQVNK